MERLFRPNSPAMRFMSNAADIVALNLIWLVCCLPVIMCIPCWRTSTTRWEIR